MGRKINLPSSIDARPLEEKREDAYAQMESLIGRRVKSRNAVVGYNKIILKHGKG